MRQQEIFARRLTNILDQALTRIDPATCQRLSLSRQQLSYPGRVTGGYPALVRSQGYFLPAAIAILVLIIACWWFAPEPLHPNTAETDILLLTGDLPPDVYADNAFAQRLN